MDVSEHVAAAKGDAKNTNVSAAPSSVEIAVGLKKSSPEIFGGIGLNGIGDQLK